MTCSLSEIRNKWHNAETMKKKKKIIDIGQIDDKKFRCSIL